MYMYTYTYMCLHITTTETGTSISLIGDGDVVRIKNSKFQSMHEAWGMPAQKRETPTGREKNLIIIIIIMQ